MQNKLIYFLPLVTLFSGSSIFANAKFVAEDVLEVTSMGKAERSNSPLTNEARCLEAARAGAQAAAIEALVDLSWPNVKGKVKREEYGNAMRTSVSGALTGGVARSRKIDTSTDPITCTVTMQFKKMNLSKCQESALQALANMAEHSDAGYESDEAFGTKIEIKRGVAVAQKISYPIFPRIELVEGGQFGGIQYSSQEKDESLAPTKAKAIMKFYQGKTIDRAKIGRFERTQKADREEWIAKAKSGNKFYGILVQVITDTVHVFIIPHFNEGKYARIQ